MLCWPTVFILPHPPQSKFEKPPQQPVQLAAPGVTDGNPLTVSGITSPCDTATLS